MKQDINTGRIRSWIKAKPAANRKVLSDLLEAGNHSPHAITHLLHGEGFKTVRQQIVKQYNLK